MTKRSFFRYFGTSPEIIRVAVMIGIRFPLSLQNMEDLLHERGIGISHETGRFWWLRFRPMFASKSTVKAIRWKRPLSSCSTVLQAWYQCRLAESQVERLDRPPLSGPG